MRLPGSTLELTLNCIFRKKKSFKNQGNKLPFNIKLA